MAAILNQTCRLACDNSLLGAGHDRVRLEGVGAGLPAICGAPLDRAWLATLVRVIAGIVALDPRFCVVVVVDSHRHSPHGVRDRR